MTQPTIRDWTKAQHVRCRRHRRRRLLRSFNDIPHTAIIATFWISSEKRINAELEEKSSVKYGKAQRMRETETKNSRKTMRRVCTREWKMRKVIRVWVWWRTIHIEAVDRRRMAAVSVSYVGDACAPLFARRRANRVAQLARCTA